MTAFVDTNVFVYVHDHGSGEKRIRARDLLLARPSELVVSTQVLAEFFWVTTRKLEPPLPPDVARHATTELAALPVVPVDRRLVLAALDTSREVGISLWDAQIVEAAAAAGCDTLFTEDLGAGQIIRGVEIVNPFDDL